MRVKDRLPSGKLVTDTYKTYKYSQNAERHCEKQVNGSCGHLC